MRVTEKIRNSSMQLKTAALRFPVTFINIATMLFVMVFVTTTDFDDNWILYLLSTVVTGTFVSAMFKLECEKRDFENTKRKVLCVYIPVVFEALWYAISFVQAFRSEYYIMSTIGIVTCSILYSLYCITSAGKCLSGTAHTLKSFCFSFFATLVVFLGGVICIGAFIVLVFDFRSSYKLFLILFEICIAIGMCLLLSGIPEKSCDKQEKSISKAYKAIILYAELPIYFALTGILYLYLLKLVLNQDFPSGGVNPYVTFASAAYIFNIFAAGIFENTSKLAKFFMKYGGILMIPVIAIQCIALGIRLYNYGFTASRFISVCFIVITLLFAIGSFIKHIGRGKPLFVAVCIVFVITCTPLNVIDVPVYQQTHTLKNTLTRNGMLENGKIISAPDDISDKDVQTIISSHNYVTRNAVKLPEFLYDYRYTSAYGLYGFDDIQIWPESSYVEEHCNYINENFAQQTCDISEYSYITKINCNEDCIVKIEREDGIEEYDLYFIVEHVTRKYGTPHWNDVSDGLFSINKRADFYYESVSLVHEPDTDIIKNIEIIGYLLER